MKPIFFPPEWYPQSAIQLTWPHQDSDWGYMLEEITDCYVAIAKKILETQKLIVVCKIAALVKHQIGDSPNLICVEIQTNDTWARDHAVISVLSEGKPTIYDFTFNGWGLKFASNFDNQINRELVRKNAFSSEVNYVGLKEFVLEGGAIESDGKGTILTTSECLLSPNRNPYLSKAGIEAYLFKKFGSNRVLWLDHGYLDGDDTDSHIDTLARFCDEHTIAYVKCEDKSDKHYEALSKMEEQLKSFVDFEGNPYQLIPLPMAKPVIEDGDRLPATYANFLIMNTTVLLPFYHSELDKVAQAQLEKIFPTRTVVGLDCRAIIKQHGSLHCITMQYPEGFIE